jgi:hypothetical protein
MILSALDSLGTAFVNALNNLARFSNAATNNIVIDQLQTTIKKDIKMEEAEELKAKLEAAGATVSIA